LKWQVVEIDVYQNIYAVKKKVQPLYKVKSCEIKGGGQDMVGFNDQKLNHNFCTDFT